MVPARAIDEIKRQVLESIQANQNMVEKIRAAEEIDGKRKLAFASRILDSSNDLRELLSLIDPPAADLG